MNDPFSPQSSSQNGGSGPQRPGGGSEQPPHKVSWILKAFFFLGVGSTLIGGTIAVAVIWKFSIGLPNIITVEDYRPLGVTRIYAGTEASEDAVIGEFYKERRYLIPYEKMPQSLIRAFISAEDDKFFEHPGINISSIIRAGIANFRAGHVVQGGSTITQQVAKSLLLTPERSMVRKIKEVILASRIERNLTKPQILYLYLNQIYLGHGAYGVQAAARTYFDKDVSQLTVAESALLAGLPQAPGKYSPLLNPKKAKERQLYVLKRMFENKYISAQEMSDAASQLVKIFSDRDLNAQYGAYYVEHLRRYLTDKYGDKAVYEDGLSVFVPSTRQLMVAARKSLVEGLLTIDKRIGFRGPIKTLQSELEVADTLRDLRLKMIDRKIRHRVLMPDGRVDALEALQNSGLTIDTMLLIPGEIYDAVVTQVDDKKKIASVLIGTIKAEITIEAMKWAKPPKDEKDPKAFREDPRVPSKVLKKWDLIKVRVTQMSGDVVSASLEQEPDIQGALLSMDALTGYVIAMEGGYNYDKSEFNRAVQSQRQPGSAFKPVIYSAAVEKGFTPATVIVDSPIVYEDTESGKWKPDNFESKFYGDTTFRHALIKSRNVPTIKILQAIQVNYVLDYLKRLGLTGQFRADLSLSLGSGGISLLELTKFYALFPRLGRKIKPIFVTKVLDRTGNMLEEKVPEPAPSVIAATSPSQLPLLQGTAPGPGDTAHASDLHASPSPSPSVAAPPVLPNLAAIGIRGVTNVTLPKLPLIEDPEQVIDPRVAYLMTHLMKEVITYGTGHAAKSLGRIAAGKTGTTNDSVDAWFMGFTPQVVTGAWVGYDSQKSIGSNETGAKAALPIWLNFMREAVKGYPEADFSNPPGVIFASIDAATGKLAAPNSSSAIKEAFLEGTEPQAITNQNKQTPQSQSEFFKEDIE